MDGLASKKKKKKKQNPVYDFNKHGIKKMLLHEVSIAHILGHKMSYFRLSWKKFSTVIFKTPLAQ